MCVQICDDYEFAHNAQWRQKCACGGQAFLDSAASNEKSKITTNISLMNVHVRVPQPRVRVTRLCLLFAHFVVMCGWPMCLSVVTLTGQRSAFPLRKIWLDLWGQPKWTMPGLCWTGMPMCYCRICLLPVSNDPYLLLAVAEFPCAMVHENMSSVYIISACRLSIFPATFSSTRPRPGLPLRNCSKLTLASKRPEKLWLASAFVTGHFLLRLFLVCDCFYHKYKFQKVYFHTKP